MMDKYQVVLGAIAVSVMVLVPVLCVLSYDLLAGRWDRGIAAWRDRRQEVREHRRSVRALRRQAGLPLEDVVANLRRLRVAVGGDASRSAAHQMGNRLAYDRLLAQACEMLDIQHELSAETAGMERDIERVRIEAELEGAGVYVTNRHFGQAA
jgi:hypothetical protein